MPPGSKERGGIFRGSGDTRSSAPPLRACPILKRPDTATGNLVAQQPISSAAMGTALRRHAASSLSVGE